MTEKKLEFQGWRRLEAGEILEEGDIFVMPSTRTGQSVQIEGDYFRLAPEPEQPKPETWRRLEGHEVILPDDRWTSGDEGYAWENIDYLSSTDWIPRWPGKKVSEVEFEDANIRWSFYRKV